MRLSKTENGNISPHEMEYNGVKIHIVICNLEQNFNILDPIVTKQYRHECIRILCILGL
jgi:hypothetical protein